MAVAAPVFKVVTQFAFEEAAFSSTDLLRRKLQRVSSAAGDLLKNVKYLSQSFLLSFTGTGASGIIGLLSQAFRTSEKFKQSQISIAGILTSNSKMSNGVKGFNDQLKLSEKIMTDISKIAFKFAIPEEEFAESVKYLAAAMLPKTKKGTFLTDAMDNVMDLTRKGLKTGSQLGLHPAQMQNFLVNAMTGGLGTGTQAEQRIFQDAPEVFKKHGVAGPSEFNALDYAKKVKVLNDVFDKFASNLGLLEMRAKTFTALMIKMRNTFFGYNSILRPIGDTIQKYLVPIFSKLIDKVREVGPKYVDLVTRLVDRVFSAPKKALLSLMTISETANDVGRAGMTATFALLITHLIAAVKWIMQLSFLGKASSWVGAQFIKLGLTFPFLAKGAAWARAQLIAFGFTLAKVFSLRNFMLVIMALGKGFMLAIPFVVKFALLFAGLIVVFQAFTYAWAKMRVELGIDALKKTGRYPEVIKKLSGALESLLSPITNLIIDTGELIFSLMSVVTGVGKADQKMTKIEQWILNIQRFALLWEIFWGELFLGFKNIFANIAELVKTFLGWFGAKRERPMSTQEREFLAQARAKDNMTDAQRNINQRRYDRFREARGIHVKNPYETHEMRARKVIEENAKLNPLGFGDRVKNQLMADNREQLLRLKKAHEELAETYIDRFKGMDEKEVVNRTTVIGQMNINQEFREKISPDRVAFSVVDILRKTEQAPTNAGQSFEQMNPANAVNLL